MPALVASRAWAQAGSGPIVIGWMHMSSSELDGSNLAVFKQGMTQLGWKEGSQYVVEDRWSHGRVAPLQELAQDLAKRNPAVIVSYPTQPIPAVIKAMPKVQIVQVSASDPVTTGFAKSLARPGGMVTGMSNSITDTTSKLLEFLLAAAPGLQKVGFIADGTNFARVTLMEQARRSAAHHKVEARFAEFSKPEDIEPALAAFSADGVQALVVMPSPMFNYERRRIITQALVRRWPTVAARSEYAEDGALLSYGIDALSQFRRAAYFVDRILKGAKAAELPIEQASTFELIVNQRTARALQISVPHSLLSRAHRVIE